ncbi:hypothetical protein OH76DRAFT_1409792 [Lentinus brumalis]|uniref:Uncharacterized protein n=1 Tax=Lentinus brumalis TaxID=2498619 RepID=A0A371CU75_9APHY|nr:hypothetical protein OH76DRAFT_1409792 [Polyporus brumalis]
MPKAERLPDSSFSEPSEPSQLRPDEKPAATLRGEQEENPQLVAHSRGRQAGDAKGANAGSSPGRAGGGAGMDRDEGGEGGGKGKRGSREADEEKRADVAGGFNVGRSKL